MILSKIIKTVATSCQIVSPKCTKLYFGWGSTPDTAEAAHSAPPDLVAGFKGPTSKRRGGRENEGRERERRGGEGNRGEGRRDGRGGKRMGKKRRQEKVHNLRKTTPPVIRWLAVADPAMGGQGGRPPLTKT